jgi:mitochondrial enoyl-[acyl-carrier protein] reductase / trans-2-enoyl-CoA reductase
MIEGTYGIKAKLPAVPGNEGVGVVTKVGDKVTSLKVGDWVIPRGGGFGTWREEAAAPAAAFDKVPNDIPAAYAAVLWVNPCTAYRLLKDFGDLQPGDYIIQNAANSMVGQAVVQLANLFGIKTINVVRADRPDTFNELRLLDNLGGTINVPSDYVNTQGFRDMLAELERPLKVAFNAVGGENANDIARCLSYGGTMVTYGGMAKRPVNVPQETINYRGLTMEGFWITEWVGKHSQDDRAVMLEDLAGWVRQEQLSLFMEMHDFDDFSYALDKSLLPFRKRKIVLNMDHPDRMKQHDELAKDMEKNYTFPFEVDPQVQ